MRGYPQKIRGGGFSRAHLRALACAANKATEPRIAAQLKFVSGGLRLRDHIRRHEKPQ